MFKPQAFAIFATLCSLVLAINNIPSAASLQIGSSTFASPGSQRVRSQDVVILFLIPSQGVTSIASFSSMGGMDFTKVVDFSVGSNMRSNSQNMTLVLSAPTTGWTNIVVNYLIEGRKDVTVGTFMTAALQTYPCLTTGSSTVLVQTAVPGWFIPATEVGLVTLSISGLRTAVAVQGLTISMTGVLNSFTGVLSISITSSSNSAIEYVKIGYTIWATSSFLYAARSDITVGGDSNFGALAGVTLGVSSFSTIELTGNLYICQGPNCNSNPLLDPFQCTSLSGTLSNGNCVFCPPGQSWNGECV